MLRQLGVPTFFITWSQADTRWVPLLKALSETVYKISRTDDEIAALSKEERMRLVRSDGVTVARYYEHRKRALIQLLKSDPRYIGKIQDTFFRDAEQGRAAMHTHGLVWVKDAPPLCADEKEICSFIDRYITCSATAVSPELVSLQFHHHAANYCHKRGSKDCRFCCPWLPMRETHLLFPLSKQEHDSDSEEDREEASTRNAYRARPQTQRHIPADELQQLPAIWRKIKLATQELYEQALAKHPSEITFDDFLQQLGINEQTYLDAISYALERPAFFLRRTPAEVGINAYNAAILQAYQANMDLQYVLDAYAAATYIVNYITASQRNLRQ